MGKLMKTHYKWQFFNSYVKLPEGNCNGNDSIMYVCFYVCLYILVWLCVHLYIYIYIHVFMWLRNHAFICIFIFCSNSCVCVYVCLHDDHDPVWGSQLTKILFGFCQDIFDTADVTWNLGKSAIYVPEQFGACRDEILQSLGIATRLPLIWYGKTIQGFSHWKCATVATALHLVQGNLFRRGS